MFNITKGISSLYISGKKRKRSDYLKPDADISTKLQNLKDKFKDLALLYDELEDQLTDVHFMNISDIKHYKGKEKQKNKRRNSIPNKYKNFNYNYNNLNDYYYSLYKKLTNKKQKITVNNNDKEKNEIKNKYNIDKEISLHFSDTKINTLGLHSNNNENNNNDKNNKNNENGDNTKGAVKNILPKKKYRYNNSKYSNYSKQNNFIPSGIKIPKKFDSNKNINNSETDNNKNVPIINIKHLSLNDCSKSERNASSPTFNKLSKSSLASSTSDTIKDQINTTFNSGSIPFIAFNNSLNPLDNLSKSTFLEDLNDYVEKDNEDNNSKTEITVHSTCTKLNTIPFNSIKTQNDLLNFMNEKPANYLKLYSSKSIRNSSSDFIFESSSESIKDKKDCIIWNKNLNINDYNNNYYRINSADINDDEEEEEESDPFENISDLSISSLEREQHLSINNINETNPKQPRHYHHHHVSKVEEKRHKRARNNSNTSDNSNITTTSTITTETTTTTTSNLTNEPDYQDDITYSELLNNPMKKHEIYQMEKSHNKFMKSWLDFENKIYSNINYFIKNDFIDLYDFLCKKSDTINSGQTTTLNDIPLP